MMNTIIAITTITAMSTIPTATNAILTLIVATTIILPLILIEGHSHPKTMTGTIHLEIPIAIRIEIHAGTIGLIRAIILLPKDKTIAMMSDILVTIAIPIVKMTVILPTLVEHQITTIRSIDPASAMMTT